MERINEIAGRTALVLETNNLRGGDRQLAAAEASLRHVMGVLASQTVPLSALAQVVITHDGLSAACRDSLTQAAGCRIDFVEISADTGYYDAKNTGFAATDPARCAYVLFADADCHPDPGWLAAMLAPFAQPSPPAVVAGRTSYADNVIGSALTTMDFMYFPSRLAAGATRNFYANNVAFRRDVFARYQYQPLEGVYRAHCQVLGMRLHAAGLPLHYAAAAHTEHRLPDTWRETLQLRWMRGEDTHALTPHLVRTLLPSWLQWLARSGPVGPLCVQLARLGCSVRALNRQDLTRLRGLRWLGGMAAIGLFSAVDMAGALFYSLGLRTAHGAQETTLSYHRR
jgi:hypothetical protein